MTDRFTTHWTRRAALCGLAAGGGVGISSLGWDSEASEAPPETTRLRILIDPSVPVLCWAPEYLAQDFLRMEGFTEIEGVPWSAGMNEGEMLATGDVDLAAPVATDVVVGIDRGLPITAFGGLHIGCIEMFAQNRVESINHLRGARVLSTHEGGLEHMFITTVLAYVGLNPRTDVEWIYEPDYAKWVTLFAEDKVDVVNAFTSLNYDFHETGIGHVILNTTVDDPWRHFYCCTITAHNDFARANPIAVKRAMRAIARAQDLCSTDPEAAAQRSVELGATDRLDYARRVMADIPYGAWREFDPAASMRFYALRLREAGLISSTPSEILERGTDFRISTNCAAR